MKHLILLFALIPTMAFGALNKTFTTPNGVTASYWKIAKVGIDKRGMKLSCEIDLYVDKVHADAKGAPSLYAKLYFFPVVAADLTGDIVAKCYSNIVAKKDPFFSGATSI